MKKSLSFLFILFAILSAQASNYYWVGGTGNWSDYSNHWATTSGGLVFHIQEPTPFDNVIFDANSFPAANDSVYIGPTLFTCNNMDWSAATNFPAFYGNSSTGVLKVYGSLTMSAAMDWNYQGILSFQSSAPGNTITTNSLNIKNIEFNGTGGSWTLMDTLNIYSLGLVRGTFYTNNNVINTYTINFGTGYGCAAYLGTSEINVANGFSASTTALTLDADSCVINMDVPGGAIFYGGNKTYHFVNFIATANAWIYQSNTFDRIAVNGPMVGLMNGSNTIDSLFIYTPGATLMLKSGQTQTINDSLLLNGSCTGMANIMSDNATFTATINNPGGSLTINYALMQDVNSIGSGTSNAFNSIIIANVTGWIVPPAVPQNLYWIGGTGNWDDPSHWSSVSGGTAGSCIPTPNTNVFFDVNSFVTATDTVNISTATAYCHDMDWTGATGNPLFDNPGMGELHLYGSMIWIPSMIAAPSLMIAFNASTPGQTITTAAKLFSNATFEGTGGSWTLTDTLNVYGWGLVRGTFYSNNQVINTGTASLGTSYACAAYLGTSVINASGNWSASSPGLTLDADSTIINVTTPGGSIFYGGNHTYHFLHFLDPSSSYLYDNNSFDKVTVAGSLFYIANGNNTIDSLFMYAPGATLLLKAGKTQTITDSLLLAGTCTGMATLKSSLAGSYATISKASGALNISDVLMQDNKAIGGATFNASNSIVISNVTGWTVPASTPMNMYWIGGTGNWDDPSHWSLSSGGAAGSCIPTPSDNVFFDASSFTGSDTVYLDVTTAYCNDMDWTGSTGNPYLAAVGSSAGIDIYGSVTFIPAMYVYSNIPMYFRATTTGKTITSGSQVLPVLSFEGVGGGWTLTDTLNTYSINVDAGNFSTNNNTINCYSSFYSNASISRSIDFGSSTINLSGGDWYLAPAGLTVDADSSIINCSYSGGGTSFWGGGFSYHEVNFFSNAFLRDNSMYDKMTFNGNAIVYGANTFDTLYLNDPGLTVTLNSALTQTITSSLMANASAGFPIGLESSVPGSQSTISMPAGDTVCLNYIYMQDQKAMGGAAFYAGLYSSDVSNNTGWNFSSCVQPISNVWPGDANYDLTADNLDILNIGLAYGETGFVRPAATMTWNPEPCLDWPAQFIDSTNIKHADCDGNGTIDAMDTTAVSLNYLLVHPPFMPDTEPPRSAFDLFVDIAPGSYPAGTFVSVPIKLGTASAPASNVYGLAFTVNYDPSLIGPGTMYADYMGSWLVPGSNIVHLEKNFPSSGQIDLGFSRIDHTNTSGSGTVAMLHFQTSPTSTGTLHFTISGSTAVDNTGMELPLTNIGDTVSITGIAEIQSDNELLDLYPNPASDRFFINYPQAIGQGTELKIYTLQGLLISSEMLNKSPSGIRNKEITTADLPAGTYFCRLEGKGINTIRKLTIIK